MNINKHIATKFVEHCKMMKILDTQIRLEREILIGYIKIQKDGVIQEGMNAKESADIMKFFINRSHADLKEMKVQRKLIARGLSVLVTGHAKVGSKFILL